MKWSRQLISEETIQLLLDNGDVSTNPIAKNHISNHIYSSFKILNDKLLKKDMEFIKNKLVIFRKDTESPI